MFPLVHSDSKAVANITSFTFDATISGEIKIVNFSGNFMKFSRNIKFPKNLQA